MYRDIVDLHLLAGEIDFSDIAQNKLRVLVFLQNFPYGIADLARCYLRAGNLIEERGEEMIVIAVYQDRIDRGMGQRFDSVKPAKSGAYDNHSRPSVRQIAVICSMSSHCIPLLHLLHF
jgi:hypothetical protein